WPDGDFKSRGRSPSSPAPFAASASPTAWTPTGRGLRSPTWNGVLTRVRPASSA
ncbi:MAG: hypothetical protein AVDCRST_MAG19-235, partial [uncultured Thermomicrobiales bacterium]